MIITRTAVREVSNARHKKTQKKSLQIFNYALFISVQGYYNFFYATWKFIIWRKFKRREIKSLKLINHPLNVNLVITMKKSRVLVSSAEEEASWKATRERETSFVHTHSLFQYIYDSNKVSNSSKWQNDKVEATKKLKGRMNRQARGCKA